MLLKLNSITILVSKQFVEAKTIDDRERHLALEMPTSTMAHADRERENTTAKQYQGKA
jgi:hypothetical protein